MNIIGHGKNLDYLEHLLATQLPAGSFLFYGQEHLGKTTVAEWFIKKLLKTEKLAGHPDFIRLTPPEDEKTKKVTTITVEMLRDILPRLHSSPLVANCSVLLIEAAEYINEEGWNLLLKTLEEPPRSAIIILVAHRLDNIPKTVLSRLLKLKFLSVPMTVLRDGLLAAKNQASRVEACLALSLGRPGVAIVALENKKITALDEAEELLSVLDKSFAERAAVIESSSKEELLEWCDRLLFVCRDAVLAQHGCEEQIAFPHLKEKIATLNQRHTSPDWSGLMSRVVRAKDQLARNANPRLVMEHLLFSF